MNAMCEGCNVNIDLCIEAVPLQEWGEKEKNRQNWHSIDSYDSVIWEPHPKLKYYYMLCANRFNNRFGVIKNMIWFQCFGNWPLENCLYSSAVVIDFVRVLHLYHELLFFCWHCQNELTLTLPRFFRQTFYRCNNKLV